MNRVLLGAVVALATLLAPSGAHAAKGEMKLAVEVTGIHVVDWSNRGKDAPNPCKAWIKGAGSKTIGFSTRRPVRYTAFSTPRIGDVRPQFVLLGGTNARYRATVARKGDWVENTIPQTAQCTPCGPLSEYGECQAADTPIAPLWDCRRKQVAKPTALLTFVGAGQNDGEVASLVDRLNVQMTAPTGGLYPHCPPELADGTGRELHTPDPLAVDILGAAARRLTKLRPGRKITLKGDAERGYVEADGVPSRELKTCSDATLAGTGYRECAVTDVTVEVRRLR